jgi:hypothetical protein
VEKQKKRALRRQRTKQKMLKRLREIRIIDRDYYNSIIKRHSGGKLRCAGAFDCGNPRCHTCHLEKLLGRRPIKERLILDKDENEYTIHQ